MTRDAGSFDRFAQRVSRFAGHPTSFGIAMIVIVAWAITGPLFHFSDTWQLAINTSTTIVTFLMVFLIQNTQNREGSAVQLKLDELIRATRGAHNALLDLEELGEEELSRLRGLYRELARHARHDVGAGGEDTGTDEVAPPAHELRPRN